MNIRLGVTLAVLLLVAGSASAVPLPAISGQFGNAYARIERDQLVVGTGVVERRWKLTDQGFVTTGLSSTGKVKREWVDHGPAVASDWAHPGLLPEGSSCKLVSLTAVEDDDEGFITKHLKVTAEFFFPGRNLFLRYEIRAFPDVPGLLTQLWIKGAPPTGRNSAAVDIANAVARVDYLPVSPGNLNRLAWGFYNNASARGWNGLPISREETLPPETSVDWASGLCLYDTGGGLMMVKESNIVTANGSKSGTGTNTGAFILDADGIKNTGWALRESDLKPDAFRWCWASWTLAYEGGRDEREMALKQLDRARFPIDPKRDMWSFLCGWGYNRYPQEGRSYAEQDLVLKMIHGCAESGIDMLLIDDGWQTADRNNMLPGDRRWRPKSRCFPNGWKPIADAAKQAGVSLGLWAMSQPISFEDLVWNQQQLDLKQFKLDFASLGSWDDLNATREKARAFFKATGHRCLITWDVTDDRIAYGYYWGREYASMHAFNRRHWVYLPWTCLRDYWLLAAYQNLDKWQLTMNNPELVATPLISQLNAQQAGLLKKYSPELLTTGTSDTARYGIGYCLATTLMGIPQVWSMPHIMSDGAKAEFTKAMLVYKANRERIFTGYVFPIGDCPDNASWTGFQSIDDPSARSGYLTVFRELKNNDASRRVKLRFMAGCAGKTLQVEDLRKGDTSNLLVDADGSIPLQIGSSADYLFLRYRLNP